MVTDIGRCLAVRAAGVAGAADLRVPRGTAPFGHGPLSRGPSDRAAFTRPSAGGPPASGPDPAGESLRFPTRVLALKEGRVPELHPGAGAGRDIATEGELPSDADTVAPRALALLRIRSRALSEGWDEEANAASAELARLAPADAGGGRGTRGMPGVGPRAASSRAGLARATLAFLGEHFRRRLALAEVSDAVESSPFHLCRAFKAEYGRTIHEHVTWLRLAASLRVLEAGTRDLGSLAEGLGFYSHAHFTSVFRTRVGITPSAFRRAMRPGARLELGRALDTMRRQPGPGRCDLR